MTFPEGCGGRYCKRCFFQHMWYGKWSQAALSACVVARQQERQPAWTQDDGLSYRGYAEWEEAGEKLCIPAPPSARGVQSFRRREPGRELRVAAVCRGAKASASGKCRCCLVKIVVTDRC